MALLLTNRPNGFQKKTSTIVTGLSDCHKIVITLLKSFFKKFPSKAVAYKYYRKFDQNKFLHQLDQEIIKGAFYYEAEQ